MKRCHICEEKVKTVWKRAYNPKIFRNGRYCATTRSDIAQGSLVFVRKDVWKKRYYVCQNPKCKETSKFCYG